MKKQFSLAFILFWAFCALSASRASAQVVYDADADFSASQNPNGAWRYGHSTSLGGPFVLSTDAGTIFGNSNLHGWRSNVSPGDQNPVVVKNFTGQTQIENGLELAPGMLGQHPGPNGEYSIVRWIAPTNGVYNVQSTFEARDRNGVWAADVHVLINGIAVFDQSFAGPLGTMSNPYQAQHFLLSGATVDFAVGRGTNTYLGDTTGLHASITAVPEPSSAVLLAAMVGLHWARRRHQFRNGR